MIEKPLKIATIEGTMPVLAFYPEGDGPYPVIIFYSEAYFGWADRDENAPEDHLTRYKTELTRHNIPHRIDFMTGAKHGYFFPERPTHYNHDAAEKSWTAVLDLFACTLSANSTQ